MEADGAHRLPNRSSNHFRLAAVLGGVPCGMVVMSKHLAIVDKAFMEDQELKKLLQDAGFLNAGPYDAMGNLWNFRRLLFLFAEQSVSPTEIAAR